MWFKCFYFCSYLVRYIYLLYLTLIVKIQQNIHMILISIYQVMIMYKHLDMVGISLNWQGFCITSLPFKIEMIPQLCLSCHERWGEVFQCTQVAHWHWDIIFK